MSEKVIVLDRDGVINEDLWGYVTVLEEFQPIEGSLEAIAKLTEAGFIIAIATNQACINKKIITEKELNEIHDYMLRLIEEAGGRIEFVAFCPHAPEEGCGCRKPKTGLLKQIEGYLGISLRGSFFVGDKEADMLCATNFGCDPILVKTGYGAITLSSSTCPPKEKCFRNLLSAVNYILGF